MEWAGKSKDDCDDAAAETAAFWKFELESEKLFLKYKRHSCFVLRLQIVIQAFEKDCYIKAILRKVINVGLNIDLENISAELGGLNYDENGFDNPFLELMRYMSHEMGPYTKIFRYAADAIDFRRTLLEEMHYFRATLYQSKIDLCNPAL
ncbi:hypothetical protein BV898_19446 [Hypsibius exemplaris]|uniref:Uncharacterized protein n=1 Tax=Hypsibius exemplaris TaxID=2072580 RepID=A0A9X6NQP3_HYPEX|nr:hypothetical protein BV898_19446 [Hypsibius exemplaris]